MPSRTAPYDLQRVPGYPKALQIYRIAASRCWQVRFFVDRKYIRKSTKTEDRSEAIEFAKQFYDDIRISQRLDVAVHTDTFHACAQRLLRSQESLINLGQRDARINIEDSKKLHKDILPYFGTKGVATITSAMIEDYVIDLTSNRKLSPSTCSKHLVVIRKVLNEARKQNYISALPIIPTLKRDDNPRPFFTQDEYNLLWRTAMKLGRKEPKVRYVPLTLELRDFIVFHVNVFVRPSDLKLLQHKHIEAVDTAEEKYLVITPPRSKTVTRESSTMKRAVDVYRRLKKRHEDEGLPNDADDFVFYPQYQNREYALQTIRRQFYHVLEESKLRFDKLGRARTIYSLRHTALMLRFLNRGDDFDIYALARNALTSVDQLERFYLSHVESRDLIKSLQSMRRT